MNKYSKKKFLIILISPSGGGKTSIRDRILKESSDIEYSISYTTREPRGKEKNGVDYFFVSDLEFQELIKSGDLVEHALVHGNLYGTSKLLIQDRISKGKNVLLDIDVQGAKQIIDTGIDSVTIFVIPPSEKILKERLINRGTDSFDIIEQRLKNAANEIEFINHFDYLVINENLDEAVKKVKLIIKAEENKIKRFKNIKDTFYGG